MTVESVETIMLRNNTTLATALEGPKMNATTSRPANASRNNKHSMLVSGFVVMLSLCLLASDTCAASINKVSQNNNTNNYILKPCIILCLIIMLYFRPSVFLQNNVRAYL